MFNNKDLSEGIAGAIAHADECERGSLHDGRVSKEVQEYTLALCKGIESGVGEYDVVIKSFKTGLDPVRESKLGCDVVLVFEFEGQCQVLLFKGILPRKNPNDWISRKEFSTELEKQKNLPEDFTVFEMFYDENEEEKSLERFSRCGSACVFRNDALLFKRLYVANREWEYHDIHFLCGGAGWNIYHLITDILMCRHGKMLAKHNGEVIEVKSKNNEMFILPVPQRQLTRETDRKRIIPFLKEYGLLSYVHVDLKKPANDDDE